MKRRILSFLTITFLILVGYTACKKDSVEDLRELIKDPIYPNEQPDELNNALVIYGQLESGELPQPTNPEMVDITISVPSAIVTNDNFLFLPFAFDTQGDLKGIYLKVVGADNYWNAPIDLINLNSNSFAIAIGIPSIVQTGNFTISYSLYDSNNNISEPKTIDVSVIPLENSCENGEKFPQVNGNDGITVRTYDFGSTPGIVEVQYYMYTLKDRMDIRYNNQWIKSTSPQLLKDGEAPPFKHCDDATPEEGFVSGGDVFYIDYNPNISRNISIYVSGCLESGTEWYFNVKCPENSSSNNNQSGVICGKVSAENSFDITDKKYRRYPQEGRNISTVICNSETDPNCTLSSVFNAMLEQSNFITPTNDVTPVEDCKTIWTNIVTATNPIVSTIDNQNYVVTNYTLANQTDPYGIERTHILHPSNVTRTVKLVNNRIVIETAGEGTGWFPNANEFFSQTTWEKVDNELKDYWIDNESIHSNN